MQSNSTDTLGPRSTARPLRRGSLGEAMSRIAETLLRDRSHPRASWWAERLAAVLALAGVVFVSLEAFHVRAWQDSASDFKTVYAAGKNFLHGVPAYRFDTLIEMYHRCGVVTPVRWYAHAPVYPPFTYAALFPVIALPVVPAVYVWMALSALALVASLWTLCAAAQTTYGLSRPWRLLLIAVVAASPLVSLGLQVGNVSMVAAPLCVIGACVTAPHARGWRVLALTASFLLKPHISLWMIVGLLVGGDREDRRVAVWSAVWIGAALACFVAVFHAQLPGQLHDLSAMLHEEVTTGSLNPHNREPLVIFVQITSLELLLGYWMGDVVLRVATYAGLAVLGLLLLVVSLPGVRGMRGARVEGVQADRLLLLTAWNAFGLIVTYHRTPDAVILFLLLPYLFSRLRRRWTDGMAWTLLVVMQLVGWGLSLEQMNRLAAEPRWTAVMDFLRFRQGACATVLFVVLVLGEMVRQVWFRHAAEDAEAAGGAGAMDVPMAA